MRLRQILGNLISNAIKFTDAGHVIIRVRRLDEQGAQARLVFEVADTGVGIEKSLHGQLFTPFSWSRTATAPLAVRAGPVHMLAACPDDG